MKRFVTRFFHSVVAVLVMTISATSAHADLNKDCELQSDYGAVLNGVAGLVKRVATEKLDAEAAISLFSRERPKLAQLANSVFNKCLDVQSERLLLSREPIQMTFFVCLDEEAQAIGAVKRLASTIDKENKGATCYSPQVSSEFENVINLARVLRGVSYGHGVERKN